MMNILNARAGNKLLHLIEVINDYAESLADVYGKVRVTVYNDYSVFDAYVQFDTEEYSKEDMTIFHSLRHQVSSSIVSITTKDGGNIESIGFHIFTSITRLAGLLMNCEMKVSDAFFCFKIIMLRSISLNYKNRCIGKPYQSFSETVELIKDSFPDIDSSDMTGSIRDLYMAFMGPELRKFNKNSFTEEDVIRYISLFFDIPKQVVRREITNEKKNEGLSSKNNIDCGSSDDHDVV